MSQWSGVLKLTDLDDFISPGQECVKPVELEKSTRHSEIRISTNEEGEYIEIEGEEVKKLQKANITLHDCLACSGCVTSSESLLVAEQSYKQVEMTIEKNSTCDIIERKYVVITISPQTQASLAAHYNMTPLSLMKCLTTYFKSIGVDMVLDTYIASQFSLLESAQEFIERYKKGHFPMLASECPGWICYAEKTQGDIILPYINTTKSPQQVMGTLIKSYLTESRWNILPNRVYHVTIMPCYDKKLEASRKDFYNDIYSTKDVDCVITTGELKEWLSEKSIILSSLNESSLDVLWDFNNKPTENHITYRLEDNGAGGYMEYIFKYTAEHLFHTSIDHLEYKINSKNNLDIKELELEVNNQIVLRFATAYGFRNISNLMRKIKNQNCPYHFVEIMACPSACLNGGGQLKHSKEDLKYITSLYHSTIYSLSTNEDRSFINTIYQEWLKNNPHLINTYFHTNYHAISKKWISNPLQVKW
jgi:iron only hydrogenase large subunit-like protein